MRSCNGWADPHVKWPGVPTGIRSRPPRSPLPSRLEDGARCLRVPTSSHSRSLRSLITRPAGVPFSRCTMAAPGPAPRPPAPPTRPALHVFPARAAGTRREPPRPPRRLPGPGASQTARWPRHTAARHSVTRAQRPSRRRHTGGEPHPAPLTARLRAVRPRHCHLADGGARSYSLEHRAGDCTGRPAIHRVSDVTGRSAVGAAPAPAPAPARRTR